jgi:PAS domain S-box-containing protein
LVKRVARLEEAELKCQALERNLEGACACAANIIETVPEPLVLLDDELRIVLANGNFYRNFKVTPDGARGHLILELGKEWSIPELRCFLLEIVAGKMEGVDFQIEQALPDGSRRMLVLTAHKMRASLNESRILLFVQDVTEQVLARKELMEQRQQLWKLEKETLELKAANQELQRQVLEHTRAEEALRDSEEKIRMMFESATDGVVTTDLNGVITEVNERALKMHGFRYRSEIIGKSLTSLVADRDRERARMNVQKALEDGMAGEIVYDLLRADGSEFPGEISGRLLRDTAGNAAGFIAIERDVSERKRMEEQLIVTDRLASVGELASGLAHELNNPLTSVIGFSQLLLGQDIADDIRRDLEVVHAEAQRCASVVKNLLTFARKHPQSRQPLYINGIIEKVLEMRSYEHKVNNIQVVIHLSSDLPGIVGDYFQLQQVFLNIVINAEYFMVEAHRQGTLTVVSELAGNKVRIDFIDDGPGISRENLGHVFDPFFTTKEVGKGTGLGLSICHGIVTEHGGRISVESQLGKGATFVVELPASDR